MKAYHLNTLIHYGIFLMIPFCMCFGCGWHQMNKKYRGCCYNLFVPLHFLERSKNYVLPHYVFLNYTVIQKSYYYLSNGIPASERLRCTGVAPRAENIPISTFSVTYFYYLLCSLFMIGLTLHTFKSALNWTSE